MCSEFAQILQCRYQWHAGFYDSGENCSCCSMLRLLQPHKVWGAQDNDAGVEETLSEIRSELLEYSCDPARTFLISAKHPECADFDFGLLLRAMAADVTVIRSVLPEFEDEANEDIAAVSKIPSVPFLALRVCSDPPVSLPLACWLP